MSDIWKQIGESVEIIESALRTYRIRLNPDQGLAQSMKEAKELAQGIKLSSPATNQEAIRIANDAHFVLAMGWEVKTCMEAGLDVSDHLKQMNTGTVNFGTPADKLHAHYLKDRLAATAREIDEWDNTDCDGVSWISSRDGFQ